MQILFKTKQLNVVSEVFIEFKNSLLFFSLFFFKWDKYVPTVLNFGMNFSQRTLWYCDAISWDIYVPTGLKGLLLSHYDVITIFLKFIVILLLPNN